jgi:methionyl-tRNA formyltransferase
MEKRILLVTSRYWEGAYVCKLLLETNFNLDVFVQKTWWRERNDFLYTEQYLRKAKEHPDRYFIIEDLTNKVQYIEDINSDPTILKLNSDSYDAIVIVGSKIIKKHIVDRFRNKIINYHTGLLPEYRGPYSEFWAIYNNEPHMIGTTIHLIDERVDGGDILKRKPVSVFYRTPVPAHIDNAIQGAGLLAEALNDYLYKNLKPVKQDESKARYYSFPTEEQISLLEQKIGEKINLYFAD